MRRPHGEREQRMGRMIGYARVSTSDQDVGLQREALRRAGCQERQIFCDTASGAQAARPGLEACLQALAPGDMLVVWRLDRLGRSMAHLVTLIEGLLQRQVGFRSLSDGAIDTTTASGELVFHIFSALAQFERRLIQERTLAGLAAARARGRRGGRRALQPGDAKIQLAYTMYVDHRWTIEELCATLGISRATCYRYVALARRAVSEG
jgi:DNA invertase Pin-like site-specific DNA recombinase